LKEFRSLVAQASSRPGYSTSRIAQELGFADASPLRKILRNPKRTTSRDRLNKLRAIAGKSSGLAASSSGASAAPSKTAASKPSLAAKSSAATTTVAKAKSPAGSDQEAWVSKSQAKDFEKRVEQLRLGGWTMDALAKRLGYHHGRSLRKTLASGNVRQRVFNTILSLSAKPSGASASPSRVTTPATKTANKTAPAPAPASRSTAPAKTSSAATPATKLSDRQVSGGVTTYLESARRHLDRARNEVERASSASQLLEPGLRALIGELDDLGRRLEL